MTASTLWNPSDQVVFWGASVLLQVTVVALIALAVALVARRSPAVRYWVLCSSLLLMLVSPILAFVMQVTGRTLWTVPLLEHGAAQVAVKSSEPARRYLIEEIDAMPKAVDAFRDPADGPAESLRFPGAEHLGGLEELDIPADAFATTSNTPLASRPIELEITPTPSPAPDDAAISLSAALRRIMPPLLLVWFTGIAILLSRFAMGCGQLARVLRNSSPNTDVALGGLFERVGRSLQIGRMPELVLSRSVSGPVSTGWMHPRVVLPEKMVNRVSTEQLRDVLIHEVAHIVRRDQLIVLLQNLASVVFWVHPLAALLNRRLAQAREEVCDNYVLATTDAPSYSRTLLHLAQLVQRQAHLTGAVGLFTSSWRLERRVAGLLDERRSRRVRLSCRGKGAVLVVSVLMAGIAALGTMAPSRNVASERSEAVVRTTAADANLAELQGNTEITVRGRVVDAEGAAIAGAELHLWQNPVAKPGARKHGPLTTTDTAGRFEMTYTPNPLNGASMDQLLATADGFGIDWLTIEEACRAKEVVIRLPNDSNPIQGQILDLEGNAVANAKVSVGSVRSLERDSLDEYVAVVKAGNGGNFRFDKYLHEPLHFEPQITDREGHFRISGIGRERVVELKVQGDSIQHVRLPVMTRESEPIAANAQRGMAGRSPELLDLPVFGASFSYLAPPSRPIVGTVVDSESRQPIAGISVGSFASVSPAISDANGRFELLGCPKSGTYRLMAHAMDDQPYLLASKRVTDRPGLEPLEVSIEMVRGILVAGRVVDASTGSAVGASISYYPIFPNDHALAGIGGLEANAIGAFSSTETDGNGEFKVVALPGPGFVGIRARQRGRYASAHVDAAEFYKTRKVPYGGNRRETTRSLMIGLGGGAMSAMPQSNFEAVELLNVDPEAGQIELDVRLTPSQQLSGRVVDADGQSVNDVDAYGLTGVGLLERQRLADGSFTVTPALGTDVRHTIFRQEDRKLVASLDITSDSDQPLVVRLQQWGEVKGRMVDEQGEPLPNLLLHSRPRVAAGEEPGHLVRSHPTDDEGNFHLLGLVPDRVYQLHPLGRPGPEVRVVVKPGQVLELGDVRDGDGGGTNAMRVEPRQPDTVNTIRIDSATKM